MRIGRTEGAARNKDYYCKYCRRENQRKYHANSKEDRNKKQRERYHNNKEKYLKVQKQNFLKREYNLTIDEYNKLMENGSCEICGKVEDLVIDHNHDNGNVRGVLCRQCNMALGLLNDSISGLEKALSYLKEKEGSQELACTGGACEIV